MLDPVRGRGRGRNGQRIRPTVYTAGIRVVKQLAASKTAV